MTATARGRCHSRTFAAWLLICIGMCLLGTGDPPARQQRGKSPIALAIESLIVEAKDALRAQTLPGDEADFATRYEGETIPADDLLAALTQRAHDDPFIDAYVRWQLTSFDPPLPEMDDRAFLKLMAAAPPMIENPKADAKVVDLFQRAKDAGRLRERDFNKLRETAGELERRATVADAFNHPAEAYRDWVATKLPEGGPRRIQWLVERTAATITAGRFAGKIKGEMTKTFRAAVADRSISPQQKEMIAEQTRRLIGLERKMIESVGFLGGGTVEVQFVTARVDKDDAEKWIAALMGTE